MQYLHSLMSGNRLRQIFSTHYWSQRFNSVLLNNAPTSRALFLWSWWREVYKEFIAITCVRSHSNFPLCRPRCACTFPIPVVSPALDAGLTTGADGGNRTRDPCFTKALLYHWATSANNYSNLLGLPDQPLIFDLLVNIDIILLS